jgi:tetratricopeptide (TPR) repeat protein
MRLFYFFILFICFARCSNSNHEVQAQNLKKCSLADDEIINKYLKNGAWRCRIFAPEWGIYIDSAIGLNPNMAYLYQQRAMPYFKQSKYEAGMVYLDKAVTLDPQKYIDYRAFIKCIFSKTYGEAIVDFMTSKKIKGETGYVMDHSYDFYLGLCYLQLNEFDRAISHLHLSREQALKRNGKEWIHYLDSFYLGIAYHETQKHNEAVKYFDEALAMYPKFADAEYYKALSLYRLDDKDAAVSLLDKCEIDFKAGYTINEDNSFYEQYPYQIKQWHIDMVKKN